MSSPVYVVHCIDTEGPLHEPLDATFERLQHAFHLDLPPSRDTLLRLQRGEMSLGGIEEAVQSFLEPRLLAYNDTWDKIDTMLEDCLSETFRMAYPDSTGKGWVYNWFCVDHVDYDTNPRRRDIGYHNIFDHYHAMLRETDSKQDGLHFHFHPHAFQRAANLCATHWWANSGALYQVLARRVIERLWFPSVNRPGFQVNRPDSHWFLEQFIPFDYSSLAMVPSATDDMQFDFSAGRSGDWRRAPQSWTPYHPDHDDYQRKGNCRRWIARCLNVGTRAYLLGETEVRQAFEEAREGKSVILSFANHDFRDIREDVANVHELLTSVARSFPSTPFRYMESLHAFRKAMDLQTRPACDFDLSLESVGGGAHRLTVSTGEATFGPQPFFALKATTGQFLHDNLDFQTPGREWTYVFDDETLPLRAVERIGVGGNNAQGVASVSVMDPETQEVECRTWNEATA